MIVEIGTSDFRTRAGQVDGLFIEPVREHFDRLPDCRKENVAISNTEGFIEIYYIPSEVIAKHHLQNWVRGCNSVHKPHPTLVKMGLEHLIKRSLVKVERIKTVLERHQITHIDELKIDTEGHDLIILNDFLDTCDIRPPYIQFESNVLSSKVAIEAMVNRLTALGYKCRQHQFDMICRL